MNIVMIWADNEHELNTSNWRVFTPANALIKQGEHSISTFHVNEFATNQPNVNEACSKADIIVIERNFFGDVLTMMQYWKVRNKIVVGNFDDAYQVMDKNNFTYKFWNLGTIEQKKEDGATESVTLSPHPMKQFKWGLSLLAGILVPSRVLMKDWEHLTNTYYLPNYLDVTKYPMIKHEHSGIIIGWGGSLSHYQSFIESEVLRALQRICKRCSNVRVMITGDKRVYDRIEIPNDQKIFQNYVPYDQWYNVLGNYDIGIAPLAGEYDKRRSWIKPLEYMIMKIPWVASDYHAYDNIKQYGNVVKNKYNEWEESLLKIIDDIDGARESASIAPYIYATKQDINNHVQEIADLFQHCIEEGYKCQ